ncbi:MAG: MerR family transcriptional regulator [Candidatus Melainabacteria bacterium]|nr:MerR family transcriptional regulator [Candidatus Melainabacteria bacterium]
MTVICNNTVMVVQGHDAFTLDELLAEVGKLATSLGLLGVQKDNRVSDLPDVRTVRYYTSLGLVDRPQIVGRQGIYGRRHILQLLAIKALQTLSLPLQEIQAKLYGLSDLELEGLTAAIAGQRRAPKDEFQSRPVLWREIVVAPGLKLMVEDGWSPESDLESVLNMMRAALHLVVEEKRHPRHDGG